MFNIFVRACNIVRKQAVDDTDVERLQKAAPDVDGQSSTCAYVENRSSMQCASINEKSRSLAGGILIGTVGLAGPNQNSQPRRPQRVGLRVLRSRSRARR